jgi:hypothetical protein
MIGGTRPPSFEADKARVVRAESASLADGADRKRHRSGRGRRKLEVRERDSKRGDLPVVAGGGHAHIFRDREISWSTRSRILVRAAASSGVI